MLTYPIAIAFAVAVYRDPAAGVAVRLLGAVAAAASLITLFCTSMIYASLKPIRQWHNAHTAPDYLIYAVFSGAVLLALLNAAVFGTAGAAAVAAVAAAALALIAKRAYWRHIDAQTPLATLASAIGLPKGTEVNRSMRRTSPRTMSCVRWDSRSPGVMP